MCFDVETLIGIMFNNAPQETFRWQCCATGGIAGVLASREEEEKSVVKLKTQVAGP